MQLFEFIRTALINNGDVFKSKAFTDGLKRYRQRYEKAHSDNEGRTENPAAPLTLWVSYDDERDTEAMSAALLAYLHDTFVTDTPIIPANWPDVLKGFLRDSLFTAFDSKKHESIESGWGLDLKGRVQLAIDTLKSTRREAGGLAAAGNTIVQGEDHKDIAIDLRRFNSGKGKTELELFVSNNCAACASRNEAIKLRKRLIDKLKSQVDNAGELITQEGQTVRTNEKFRFIKK